MANTTVDFLADLIKQEEWRRDAACKEVGPDDFYPDETVLTKQEVAAAVKRARAVCATCPSKAPCLEWALDNPNQTVEGIWAETSYGQRKRIRARRLQVVAEARS